MATMLASYVTYLASFEQGSKAGKRVTRRVKLTVPKADTGGYGDGTNPIPASIFGLQYIEEVTNAVDSNNKLIPLAPKNDGSQLLAYDLNQATDANRSASSQQIKRIDASNDGVFYFSVKGYV